MKTSKIISIVALCLVVGLGGSQLLAQQTQENGPAESARRLLRRMELPEQAQAWLGVDLAEVTQSKVRELKLPGDYGAIVTDVVENSPAAKAGLKANDVILEFGGMEVWSAAQLRQLVDETPPGREVTLRVSRDGRKFSLQATLQPPTTDAIAIPFRMPRINIPNTFFEFAPFGTRGRLGIDAQELTPQLASYFGVKQGKGVLVAEVEAGSPAAKAGIKAGDCIVRADSTEVGSIADLRRALAPKGENDHSVTLVIVRSGHEESLHVDLPAAWNPHPEQEAENWFLN